MIPGYGRLRLALVLLLASVASGQTAPNRAAAGISSTQEPAAGQSQGAIPPSLTLSPAVIMARGNFGQGLTQTLTLTNHTGNDFVFDMVADDEIVKDGKRVFVPAGETEHSIAASAVFSQKRVVVKANTSASVDVRLTIPAETKVRAVVATFKGTNVVPSGNSSVGMTASLGALITFNLTSNIQLLPENITVKPVTESSNLTVSEWISNIGTEPVLPEGVVAVLNSSGGLVAKMPFPTQRLLPGERLEFAAEYPDQLQPGSYKALCSFQFDGKTLTSEAAFKVP